MQRKIWTQMKDLFLAMQSKMLDVHSSFNWETGFNKKYSDTQLTAIQDKVNELEKAFNTGIAELQDAIENPVEDSEDSGEEGSGDEDENPDPEHKSAVITTDIAEKTFTVGKATEFSFSTVANDDAGVMVVGTANFNDPDAIEKLEYFEVKDSKWYELKGDFGPASGFPMSDATSKFRATFKKGGNYSFTASMKKVEDSSVLCSVDVSFTVAEA